MEEGRKELVTLAVPSDLRYGEALRALLDVLSRRLEGETRTPDLNAHVISAFNEAFNNAVQHGHGGSRDLQVDIEVTLSSGGITIAVADRGSGFDLDTIEAPDLEELPESGLGLMIIKAVMSSVSYHRDGDRNVLTMKKDFAHPLQLGSTSRREG